MTGPWFAAYEAGAARGALMRVHTRGCSCGNCRYEFRPTATVTPSHEADEFDGDAWDLAHDRNIDARNGVW